MRSPVRAVAVGARARSALVGVAVVDRGRGRRAGRRGAPRDRSTGTVRQARRWRCGGTGRPACGAQRRSTRASARRRGRRRSMSSTRLSLVEVGQVVDGDVGGVLDVGQRDRAEVLRDARKIATWPSSAADVVLVLRPGVRGIRAAADDDERRAAATRAAGAASVPRRERGPSSARVDAVVVVGRRPVASRGERRRLGGRAWSGSAGCRSARARRGADDLRLGGRRGRLRRVSTTSATTTVTLSGVPASRASATSRSAVSPGSAVLGEDLVDGVARDVVGQAVGAEEEAVAAGASRTTRSGSSSCAAVEHPGDQGALRVGCASSSVIRPSSIRLCTKVWSLVIWVTLPSRSR